MADAEPEPGPSTRRACGCPKTVGALHVLAVRDRGGLAVIRVRHDRCGRRWSVIVTPEDET